MNEYESNNEAEGIAVIFQLAYYLVIKPVCYLLYYAAKGIGYGAYWLFKKATGRNENVNERAHVAPETTIVNDKELVKETGEKKQNQKGQQQKPNNNISSKTTHKNTIVSENLKSQAKKLGEQANNSFEQPNNSFEQPKSMRVTAPQSKNFTKQ